MEELQEEFGDDISMPSQMVQDACEQHMERWDGSGYPYGSVEDEISLIAQIVGMAKELDRLLCERKSETPYEEAVDTLLAEDNQDFSPNLKDVFQACQPELKNVFKKYIQYTRIMPKTVPLVEKREGRPFGLNYRQIVAGRGIGNMMFQAVHWFAGVLNKPDARESIEEVEELLLRTGMVGDMTTYFLYEAADLIARMQNCDLQTGGVLLPVFNSFYTGENQTDRLKKMLEDTGIDKKKLILVVPETLVRGERSIYDRLSEYIGLGIVLMLDDYHPEDLPLNLVREIGFTHVRLAEDADAGIIPKERIQEWRSHGITLVNQPAGNAYLTEEELIKYLLLHE